MQLEVILPLVAYLVVVFGISVYAMRKRIISAIYSDIGRTASAVSSAAGSNVIFCAKERKFSSLIVSIPMP